MKASEVSLGFNVSKVRAAVDNAEWDVDHENPDNQRRAIFLGTVFALSPSGKYYTAWASGNLAPCPTCRGHGRVIPRRYKRRTQKKQTTRHKRLMAKYERLNPRDLPWAQAPDTAMLFLHAHPLIRTRHFAAGATCTACCGSGSREEYLDELWRVSLETALNAEGLSLEAGEGDPCDLFAVESRDTPEDVDDDGEPIEGENTSDNEHDVPGYGVWNGE